MSEQSYEQSSRPPLRVLRPGSEPATLDEGQLRGIYRRHGGSLFRYLLIRTFGDEYLAEDILQETFLRAWRTPELMNDRPETCRAWLITVARNLVIDRLRRRGHRSEEVSDDALEVPVGTVKSRLHDALHALRVELSEPVVVAGVRHLAVAA